MSSSNLIFVFSCKFLFPCRCISVVFSNHPLFIMTKPPSHYLLFFQNNLVSVLLRYPVQAPLKKFLCHGWIAWMIHNMLIVFFHYWCNFHLKFPFSITDIYHGLGLFYFFLHRRHLVLTLYLGPFFSSTWKQFYWFMCDPRHDKHDWFGKIALCEVHVLLAW